MSDLTTNEKIQQLEQRHVKLLDELNALNQRLEETLSSFAKPTQPESGSAESLQDTVAS